MEVWKDIKDYEGLYQVSNKGKIKSIERKVPYKNSFKSVREKIRKLTEAANGYYVVSLSKNGKSELQYVHILVAVAFLPNPHNLPVVNHKSENKHQNNVENLEWCSQAYNNRYGTAPARTSKTLKGKKQSQDAINKRVKKLNKEIHQFTLDGELVGVYESVKQAMETNHFSKSVLMCAKGQRKTAHGYIWRYKKEDTN